jgi:nucleoside-diphosphate-sugar epimerase
MQKVLIAGCGYLGLATARLFAARGWEVTGLARSPQTGGEFPVLTADLADAASLTALPECEVVVHCASSGRGGAEEYRRVYLDGMRNLARRFPSAQLMFTSSTSVYAQNDGSLVDEGSAAEPTRETGQILRAAEDVTLAAGGCVARLAGIYGPGRSVLLQRFFSGEAVIEDDGARAVNQIHRDDAASALVALAEQKASGIFNVSDDTPLTQREVYTWLAVHFQRPVPPTGPVNPNRKRGVTNKRVSNAKLRGLGWAPHFPSFRDAVTHDAAALAPLTSP